LLDLAPEVSSSLVDFYTAWKVISKQVLDYYVEPAVAHR
jgi:hypothetical protein